VWTETILHVDMDAFFVEVERRRNPGLIGRPVAVGGTGPRGVIASASYEARSHGVHSAQATSIARRLCPELEIVPTSHGLYEEVSGQVFAVFRSFTPTVEGLSLDEAFLDVSGLSRHFDAPRGVAEAVKGSLEAELGLPASVGAAGSKFMAKLASAAAKPNGILVVPLDRQIEFLHRLDVGALWGVGPATLAGLQRLGVETVGDLAQLPEGVVLRKLGPTNGHHLLELSQGIDHRPVVPDNETKSISVEETYDDDLVAADLIEASLLAHSHRLAGRLRRAGLAGRTVTLKVRFDDFTTVTRTLTVETPVDSPRDLYRIAKELIAGLDLIRPVRLLGLGSSALEDAGAVRQMRLDSGQRWERLAAAISGVRDRFGEHSVDPARLLDMGGPQDGSDQ
jgi:DNA polymerase IV